MLTTTIVHQSWSYELEQLRDEIYFEQCAIRGDFTIQDAARCAIAAMTELEGYCEGWDRWANEQLLQAYAPRLVSQPEPTPPATPAARKAALYDTEGVRVVRSGRGYLVPSASRNIVHFVADNGGCSCEASRAGRECWHTAIVALQTQKRAA